ncbi:MAG: DUF2478 domain-containing protein [Rhodobacter sp.]|nr:DUF2478 domain-containing protein [Paracoccaceae bacterium]MCC0076631.1 DUF2478 domain-containing protein [Rhodobacter sp.]
MQLAYTLAAGRGDTNLLLLGLARRLMARGLRLAGTVQINTDRADGGPCDMDVLVLPNGPVLRISQSLGRDSRGCRLDPSALEAAVGHVAASLDGAVDLLILNKFGKHEAEGRGFRPLIAEAALRGIPVLTGLNGLNRDAFQEFAGGLAVEVTPRAADLEAWCRAALGLTASPPQDNGAGGLGQPAPVAG